MATPSPESTARRGLVWASLLISAACLLLAAAAVFGYAQNWQPAPVVMAAAIQPTGSPAAPSQAASRTPFLPVANTTTPTRTATPTQTATITPSPSPTATFTPSATQTATITQTPTAAPTEPAPPPLPASAYVDGLVGYPQTLSLSCESRSAVDWAAFYGLSISELEFQHALPASDNPNRGFVGYPNGPTGQIPPASYGAHAAPVAALLRAYGLSASEYSGLSLDDLRRSLAYGHPVIVWVIGSVLPGGYPQPYTAADGETLTVAAGEHTVIVVGYDENTVTVQDGGMRYSPSIERFLSSWGVLGNMGILYGR